MSGDAGFRRLVLAVGHGEAGPATLRSAAALAALLRLSLHCVLIEDEALAHLPALPFARELRLATGQWRKLEPAGLADEMAAGEAALRGEVARLAAGPALEVRRGDPVLCMGGVCVAGDIVVLAAGQPRPAPHQVALRSAAAVLLLPPGAAAAGGPVVALAAGPDAPAAVVAARIAAAAGAELLIRPSPGRERARLVVVGREGWAAAEGLGVPVLVI